MLPLVSSRNTIALRAVMYEPAHPCKKRKGRAASVESVPGKGWACQPGVEFFHFLNGLQFTSNSIEVLREAEPDVAVMVMGYLPAGVPVVVVVEVPFDPQAAWSRMRVKKPPRSRAVRMRRLRDNFPPKLKPSSASPDTGSQVA